MQRASPHLALRVVLALALTIGFYALALGLAAALLYIPWKLYDVSGSVNAQTIVVCVGPALVLLFAILPRVDRFSPPGPALAEAEHPQLFALIRRIAAATSQAAPADVYLIPDMNAWVANRGGVLGFGSRRLMGVGLPAIQALTVPQLAAILAHEFGHYHHADVALGPWLYRLRQSIGRTLDALEQRHRLLAIPFDWYALLFLRTTAAVSRRQEFAADALAARVVGKDALTSGLEVLHGGSAVYEAYWETEVVPVLASGRRPPITAGFAAFAAHAHSLGATSLLLQAVLEVPGAPFDTHPPLAQRLAAIAGLPAAPSLALAPAARAIDLLGDVAAMETALVAYLAGPDHPALEPICWEEVGADIWIPIWRERVSEHGARLHGLHATDACALAANRSYLAVRMKLAPDCDAATEEHRTQASKIFGAAITLLLLRDGATLSMAVGQQPVLELDGVAVMPFRVCHQLEAGELSALEWLRQCQATRLEHVRLSDAAAPTDQIALAHAGG